MSNAAASATMKLLVHTTPERLLFAEAGKDVVDFILGLLAMPLGAAVSLLRSQDATGDVLGSLASVYASVEKMDATYVQGGGKARDAVLAGYSLVSSRPAATGLVPATGASTTPPSGYSPYVAAIRQTQSHTKPPYAGDLALLPPPVYRCHLCLSLGSPQGSKEFVEGAASYVVMDDLTVTPASKMSTVALLGTLGVKDLGVLEERTVTIGRKECLEILKVSMHSKTVLTDVFPAKTNLQQAASKTKKRWRAAGNKDNDAASSSVGNRSR